MVPEGLSSFAVEVATIQDEHSDNLEQFSLSGKTSYQEQAESGIATILDNEAPLVDLNGAQSGVGYSSSYVEGDEARLATFDISVVAKDDSNTIVETGSISVDVHPDADKPILNIGGFAQVAAIDFEDVTIKSGSWDSNQQSRGGWYSWAMVYLKPWSTC